MRKAGGCVSALLRYATMYHEPVGTSRVGERERHTYSEMSVGTKPPTRVSKQGKPWEIFSLTPDHTLPALSWDLSILLNEL